MAGNYHLGIRVGHLDGMEDVKASDGSHLASAQSRAMQPWRAQAINLVKSHLAKTANPSVLDATCGLGASTCAIMQAAPNARVSALDRVPSRTQAAAKHIAAHVDAAALSRITLLPLDCFAEDSPGAPFDVIVVSVAVPSVSYTGVGNLVRQLKVGGRLVAPVVISNKPHAVHLVSYDRGSDGALLCTIEGGAHEGVPAAERSVVVEGESVEESAARARRVARRSDVEAALTQWRSQFTSAHGRRPTRNDLAKDAKAAKLFDEFAALNRA